MNSMPPEAAHRAKKECTQLCPGVRIRLLGRQELGHRLEGLLHSHLNADEAEIQRRSELRKIELAVLSEHSGIPQSRLQDLEQVHGSSSLCLRDASCVVRPAPKADALFTGQAGLGLIVRTADCVPVFFAFQGAALVAGVIHSGWRGTDQNIAGRTLERAFAYCQEISPPEQSPLQLSWALGPSISQENYEVGEDVAASFRHLRRSGRPGHFLLDLCAEICDQVEGFCERKGIECNRLRDFEACTVAQNDRYFSHRMGDGFRNLNMIEIIGNSQEEG